MISQIRVGAGAHMFFRAMRKLPPGHSLTVYTAGTLLAPGRVPRVRPAGDDEYAAEFLNPYGRARFVQHLGARRPHSVGCRYMATARPARSMRRNTPASTGRPIGKDFGCTTVKPSARTTSFPISDKTTPSPQIGLIKEPVLRQAANLGLRVQISGLGRDEGVSFTVVAMTRLCCCAAGGGDSLPNALRERKTRFGPGRESPCISGSRAFPIVSSGGGPAGDLASPAGAGSSTRTSRSAALAEPPVGRKYRRSAHAVATSAERDFELRDRVTCWERCAAWH